MQHNEFEGQAGAPGADAGTGTTAPGAAPDAGSEGAAGDSLEMCPAELHSTTAQEASEIFFVLLDPQRASA